MIQLVVALTLLPLLAACSTAPTAPAAAIADLAPTGKLRAAINFGNPILATRDAATGEPRGVSVDLSHELAKRLRVPVELVTYDAAGKVVEGVKSRADGGPPQNPPRLLPPHGGPPPGGPS